jgi:Cdc6-like AAA superfamily ATPase
MMPFPNKYYADRKRYFILLISLIWLFKKETLSLYVINYNILVITGNPGVGKTMCIHKIVKNFQYSYNLNFI